MKARFICAGIVALAAALPAYSEPPKGFEEFRKGIMKDFDSFRNRILEHYADFLAGEWHEYESLEPLEKYSEPKPSDIPAIEDFEVEEGGEQKKELMLTMGFSDVKLDDDKPKNDPAMLNWIRGARTLYCAAPPADEKILDENVTETPAPGDIVTGNGLVASYDGDIFSFYGMEFGLPAVQFDIEENISGVKDFSKQWKRLDSQKVGLKLIPGIQAVQQATGLSDYLVFEMIMAYADHKFPKANDASKMSFTHYILCQMEFGARLALDDNGRPYMLLPFDEPVYGRSFINLERTYYLYATPGRPFVERAGLSTPALPEGESLGKALGLRIDGLKLPYSPYYYSFEHAGLKIEGEMNQNVIPLLYKYPQMDTSGFAQSTVLPEVRDDVVRQLQLQLGTSDPLKSADRLLALIQYGFPYATDDNYHGFEKPYFFEETLFYPKSDCEDRAVFYSYLLWNALGLESDLIAYPNHEATSIRAEKVPGGDDHYKKGESKFFISDPTCQGAMTGHCHRRFRQIEPKIDLSYGR